MNAKRAFGPVINVLSGMGGRILAAGNRRRTEQLVAHFSTRRLKDIGFERDWDGSVYRPSDYR
ncbi:MAG TPA: DUF1127 domain-containing protein [Bauldia sp.]|nr:DUF1127 domain-containing protein [Bauldia sp.]